MDRRNRLDLDVVEAGMRKILPPVVIAACLMVAISTCRSVGTGAGHRRPAGR